MSEEPTPPLQPVPAHPQTAGLGKVPVSQPAILPGVQGEIEQVEVTNLGSGTDIKVGAPFDPSRFQAETARNLAIFFIAILALSLAIHYVAVVLISIYAKSPADLLDRLEKIFNAWLPVISSLVSSVAAFYFAKSSDKPK